MKPVRIYRRGRLRIFGRPMRASLGRSLEVVECGRGEPLVRLTFSDPLRANAECLDLAQARELIRRLETFVQWATS